MILWPYPVNLSCSILAFPEMRSTITSRENNIKAFYCKFHDYNPYWGDEYQDGPVKVVMHRRYGSEERWVSSIQILDLLLVELI
jgi:hypothetical protein